LRGLDTNVLVRYLTQDDPRQSRKANALIDDPVTRRERCFISLIVCCELVWVLREAYRFPRETIAHALAQMLDTAQFQVEERDLVGRALDDYRRGPADFSDYVIGWRNRHAGCSDTATFDLALRRSELFSVL
jgi:predicted nucleic-acid-binding protein